MYSCMLGTDGQIIKLDYIHFMPDIRLRIKITIDIYTSDTIQYIAMKGMVKELAHFLEGNIIGPGFLQKPL